MQRTRVLIVGAAGRDFHNFNLVYRGREEFEVVGFTATQIPNIDGRVYPAELAGELYPEGIPISPESELEELVRLHDVDEVVFAYSDVTHEHVMHIGSRANAAGASFRLISPRETMLTSSKPVVAVCAVRTGSGKSQTTRHIAALLRESGKQVAVLRHPMPYGDLTKQAVQRFERYEDLEAADATIEEREEYEPHLAEGNLVFAGIDYAAILDSIREHNPGAKIVLAASPFVVEGDVSEIAGKRVLAIEDGPTLTHGEMTYGAAVLAAKANGAAELIDPREAAVGSIAKTFRDYPHVGALLPAMGYGRKQMEDLRATIEGSGAELVLIGTPIDLRRLIDFDVPALRVTYRLQEIGEPTLETVLTEAGLMQPPALV